MAKVVGLLVYVYVSGAPGSGTDDPVYLGISGRRGGREFPLNRSGKNDWEAGQKYDYVIGTVPDNDLPKGADFAIAAQPGKRNSPDRFDIVIEGIDRVYIRKRAGISQITDDAVSILQVNVSIYDDNGAVHAWSLNSKLGVWLGTEYGSRVGLTAVE